MSDSIFSQYNTSPSGLTTHEANSRLETYGRNELKAKKKTPLIIEFLKEFTDLMVIVLIFAAIIAGVVGEKNNMIAILVVIFLNAIISFIQKFKAEKAIEALKKMIAAKARIIRDGQTMEIDAKFLVPGDILVLNEGDKVSADGQLIEVSELQVSEAILTGESIPVSKQASHHPQTKEDYRVFMGTLVSYGTGRVLVTATGMTTEFGKIAKLTTETKKDKSPLEKEISKIGVFVGKITLVLSLFLFAVIYFFQDKTFVETFLFATAVAVAAVPEGLPATITIALALGVQRLAKKNAIIKQLTSVETLGSTTVICTDKTGTLTKNEMTVKEISSFHLRANLTGVGYNPDGAWHLQAGEKLLSLSKTVEDISDEYKDFDLKKLAAKEPKLNSIIKQFLLISSLCNNASLHQTEAKTWTILGDPTEGSLLTMSAKAGFNLEAIKNDYERIQELPFDSTRKRMSVIVKDPEQNLIAYTKGAPDSLLTICSRYLDENGEVQPLTENIKNKFQKDNESMAKKALRVLGFAYKNIDTKETNDDIGNRPPFTKGGKGGVLVEQKNPKFALNDIEQNLIFLGLVGIIDPPRPEVREAVKLSKQAGIKIYVITGDQALTAGAIAEQLGIIDANNKQIVTGDELNKLENEQLSQLLKTHRSIIFARVSPEHKLHIVDTLKKLGEIVAVTGDGVNDAPAIKRADIGIAMGITGTDVSKEAANMILTDDSYSTIVTAIQEGRTIYQNLKKFIFYLFSSNIGELFTILIALVLNVPTPLTAILILLINLGTDVLPALALGVDPHEPGIMEEKPRHPAKRILEKAFIYRCGYIGLAIGFLVLVTYFWTLYRYGWSFGEKLTPDNFIYLKATTVAFATLVMIQIVNTFNCRSERDSIFRLGFFSNFWLLGAIVISVGLAVVMIELPLFQNYVHTIGLDKTEWLVVVIASFGILIIEELRKKFWPLAS